MSVEDASGLSPGAVIYQVYPRSFLDSDRDGIGDLRGIVSKLAYVASLGVDAVWLSPVFPSPMADFGYDVADHCGVDPLFGDMADFDRLVAEAHRLGLKVIVDQIYGHTSNRHPWFEASRRERTDPMADWYVWADAQADGSPPNNWLSVFYGPAWTWDARRRQYYLHNFLPEQPQLNVHHREVQDALLEVARFWWARGVDGLRLDAINFLMHDKALRDNPAAPADATWTRPFDRQAHLYNQSHPDIAGFLERLRALGDALGGRFLVAEVPGERAREEIGLYMAGRRVHTAYGFDFLYAPRLDAALVRRVLAPWPQGWPAFAFSNHDAPRAVSRWAAGREERAYAELLLLLLVSLPGHIFLYQGEELGLVQGEVPYERLQDPEAKANWPQTLGRDGARTPMPWIAGAPHAGFSSTRPWLPVDSRHADRAVDVQEADANSTLNVVRRLLEARRRHPALRLGDVRLHAGDGERLVFERVLGGQTLTCAFNLGFDDVETGVQPGGLRVVCATSSIPVHVAPPLRLAPCQGFIAVRD